MTSYRIDEFWQIATDIGFIPLAIKLKPSEPLISEGRYAYFALAMNPA